MSKPRKLDLVGGIITSAVLVALVGGTGTAVAIGAHNAQMQADADKAMTAAAPAYQGAIELGGNLDALNVQAVQAKRAYDAEQARIAAEQAAEAAAAALAAQQAAAQAAAQQQAAQQAAAQQAQSDPAPANDVPFIPDPNSSDGGRFDTSQCGAAGATTNADGSVSCAG